jgi:branched-subunit amino acid ABC-type transport system permease component
MTLGSIYAMLAIGLVLMYRVSATINFAHVAIATLGAYVMLTLSGGDFSGMTFTWFRSYPPWLGITVATLCGIVLGAVLYLLLFVARRREASPLSVGVATIGLMVALQFGALQIWTDTLFQIPSPFPRASVQVFDVQVTAHQLGILGFLALVTALLYLWLNHTKTGVATRALTEDPMAAELVGVDTKRIQLAVWAVAGGLGSLAGCLILHLLTLQPTALVGITVKALAAAIIGRLTSLPMACAGGFLIAYVEVAASQEIATVNGIADGMVAVVVLVALLLQREGRALLTRLRTAVR